MGGSHPPHRGLREEDQDRQVNHSYLEDQDRRASHPCQKHFFYPHQVYFC